uniref:Protein Ycf2 n=1 Tax=Adiantum capillus-veneris TaxID=13818 RepID=YCF2_ADICA|nr:Ycf2 [Adiantum capillus-veneris]NP_848121.2 Ycf2 [Adiantum capillus-veneris]Q85B60.2 RecName: Full=Protein Ycf2 [Adiantum capillus-veneris]AAP29436.2 hypothetical protein [Adiantum capillus-veneris]AAP29454.2 hypothetical protein [Adiantum capillus-veneris]
MVKKVIEKGRGVRGRDYSSKVWDFLEIDALNYFSESLKNHYLEELVVSPASTAEPFIRLSDLRFLSLLFLRNLRHSIMRGSGVTLEMLMLLAIPIFMHCLSYKNSIDRGFVLAKVIDGGEGIRKKQTENYGNFSYDCFLQFKRFLSVGRDGKREILEPYYLGLNKDISISASSSKEEREIRYDVTTPLPSGRWKARIMRRDSLLFGGDRFKGKTEGIQVVRGGRYLQDLVRFFKFYKNLVVSKNGSDCHQNNFDSLLLREICDKQDLGRLQAIRLGNNSLSSVVLYPFESESADSADPRRDGSAFPSEQEVFSNLYSFTSREKTILFRNSISGLDYGEDEGGFPVLHAYSQVRNQLINRLTNFLSIIRKSNLPLGGKIVIDVSNRIKSERVFFPSGMKKNMPFTKISGKKLRLASGGYFDFVEIFPTYFKASLEIPRETTNQNGNTNFLDELEGGGNLDSIYSLVRLYGRNRIIPLYSTYIFLLHDYFCALSTEYFFRIKYWLDGWTGGRVYISFTGIATEETVFKWKDDVERLSNEYVTSHIGQCRNVQSNLYRRLDATRNLYVSPVKKFLGEAMKYNLAELICRVSLVGNELLNKTGVSLRSTNRHTKKYFHRFLDVLFLSKMIVAEATRQKILIDTVDYCIEKLDDIDFEKLNKMDRIELDFFSSLSDGYIDEEILLFKTILEERKSFLVESRLLTSEKSVGSSTALKPASNFTSLGLSCIEAIRAGFSGEALSIMGRQNWNLFVCDLSRGGNSIRNIGESLPKNISDQMDEINNSPIRSRAGNNFIQRIKRGFFVGNCSNSYLDVLENFYLSSDEKAISSSDILSLIHLQLSDSLSSNFSKQTAGEVADHLLTPIQLISPNLHESATIVTHLDGLPNSISDLNGLLASLSSSPREATDSFLFSCSNDGVSLEEASRNSDSWSDHQRTQPRRNLLVLDRVNSEKFFKDGLDSRNGSPTSQVYRNGLSIEYFWEPKKLDTPYWSLRFSLFNGVTSRFIAGSIGEDVTRQDAGFADSSAREEATCPSHFINFNELSEDLNRYKISWIFWRDSIGENWSLLGDYIPLFFTPTWWRYFCDLITKAYPEIVLKISYDSNHDLRRISEGIARGLVGSAKGYLLRSLQRLGLIFGNNSINTISSETDLLILEKIPDKAEILHPGEWSVSQFSNRPISYCCILSILLVLLSLKHPLSAVSGSNFFHLWKRFATIDYLTDPMRGSYLRKVMYSPPTSQMLTRDLLIHSLNRFLNCVSNILFFLFVKNEIDSWIFRRESSDILDSNKELLTQHLVTTKILYRYASKSKFNYDLSSNKIFHEPYPQDRSNVLAYLLQFWQNDLLGHKIRKLDPAEKWAFSALGRDILFSATTRRRDSLLNMPCRDIPISLQSGLLPSKGILLVGPVETGRSSLIRDVASNSYFPVVKLPLKKFIYNRSFFNNVRGNFISKESVHRLNIVFEIAKEMSPCTLWIQDIHELNICRSYNKLEADPKFLLCQILKSIGHKLGNSDIRENVVIATTHVPARIDPALVAPNRLNQLINFRRSNGRQRQKELSILLRIKGFEVGANPTLLESTVSGTAGYSKRDLLLLANEALLIGTSKGRKFVCSNTIGLALHRQHSTVSDMGNEMESNSEWEISSYKMAEVKNSLTDISLTTFPFIGRDELKMRFYYLSNWYVEPSTTESTIDEFTMFLHLPELIAKLVARDSFQMDRGKEDNFIVIDKLVENDLNLACGVLENLSNNFPRPEICRGESRRSNSFPPPLPIGKPKYCSGVTSLSRSSKSLKRGRISSLTDFEMQQSPELRNSAAEISREITWSRKAWRLRFLRSGTYELMGVLSEPNHLYNLILLYYNQNYIPQQDFEFSKIRGKRSKWREKSGYLFSFEKSVTNGTDNSIKRLENRLDNMLLREQFLELGISGDSSNEYETHCDRLNEMTRLFGGRFIWDPMLLFQPDPNIPSLRRNLLSTKELARRLHTIYGMRRQRLQKMSNNKIKDFFLYSEENPKLKPDSSLNRRNNLPLEEEERDSEYVRETSSVDIHLQYPQIFTPVRLGCYAVAEDFPERFLRFRLLVHRNKWLRRNRSPFRDFLIYNMLLETYEYLSNPFRFGKASLD